MCRSEITGLRGLRILDAILAGERNPVKLADLPAAKNAEPKLPKRTKKYPYEKRHYEPINFGLRAELSRIFGVDLTNVPGISAVTAHTILCEVGTDLSRFRNASAFASWLGLCPEKQISGGKILYTRTRPVRNRVALALCLDANSLHHAGQLPRPLLSLYERENWQATGGHGHSA